MRIGALLDDPADLAGATAAGVFGVMLSPAGGAGGRQRDDLGGCDVQVAAAAEVAALTSDVRVLVQVVLGCEHPVTLAEEVAVLDHLSGGRAVVVVDPGGLDDAGAAEDLRLLRACWSGRPVQHDGARWRVPSGVMAAAVAQAGGAAPTSLAVTPQPAQIEVPVWLLAPVTGHDLPVLATAPDQARRDAQVQPALADLSGDLGRDRALVAAWSAAGATHLLVRPPDAAGRAASGAPAGSFFTRYVARHLQPEVSMPAFPRIMAEAALPAAWTP